MPHKFKGERTLMRIFIGESDRCADGPHKGKHLHEALVAEFRGRGLAGVTVVRAISGFGATARMHTDTILRLSLDLPIIVEVVETEAAIQAILPVLDEMIGGGLITLEKVRVILYRSTGVAEDERCQHRIEGLVAEDLD